MNKKVFISMLVLTISFLVGLYVAKIFFPQEFVMIVENENIVRIGNYIDTHDWLYYIITAITSFLTYYLYCCACSHRLRLKWWECLIIIFTNIVVRVVSMYDVNVSTAISITSFLWLPAIMQGNLKTSAIVYSIHTINQSLSLTIRNVGLYLQHMNTVVLFIMLIDMYFWLLLFYIIFNYKENKNVKI